jgi:hypothetical protein
VNVNIDDDHGSTLAVLLIPKEATADDRAYYHEVVLCRPRGRSAPPHHPRPQPRLLCSGPRFSAEDFSQGESGVHIDGSGRSRRPFWRARSLRGGCPATPITRCWPIVVSSARMRARTSVRVRYSASIDGAGPAEIGAPVWWRSPRSSRWFQISTTFPRSTLKVFTPEKLHGVAGGLDGPPATSVCSGRRPTCSDEVAFGDDQLRRKDEVGKRAAEDCRNLRLSRPAGDRFGWAKVVADVVVGEDIQRDVCVSSVSHFLVEVSNELLVGRLG